MEVDASDCHAYHTRACGDKREPSAPPEPAQFHKCHACHTEWRSMLSTADRPLKRDRDASGSPLSRTRIARAGLGALCTPLLQWMTMGQPHLSNAAARPRASTSLSTVDNALLQATCHFHRRRCHRHLQPLQSLAPPHASDRPPCFASCRSPR